jgi:ABC-2 type transport system permease protein
MVMEVLYLYYLYKGYWFYIRHSNFWADTLFWTRGMGQSARARFIDAKSRFNKEQP